MPELMAGGDDSALLELTQRFDATSATVTVLKEGLSTPTAVEPAGDTIWIAERGAGKAVSIPMLK